MVKNVLWRYDCEYLNNEIENCNEKYICFSFPEVNLNQNKTEQQLLYFKKNPSVSVLGTSVSLFHDNKKDETIFFPLDHDNCYKLFYNDMLDPVFEGSVMIERESILNVGGFSPKIRKSEIVLQEALFPHLLARLLLKGYQVNNLKESLVSCHTDYFYRTQSYYSEIKLIWGMFRRKTFRIKPLADRIFTK